MALLHVTKDNFEELVLGADRPVLIDFFATWCGPCRMIAPTLETLAEEHPEYVVCKVNVDEEGALAQEFGVSAIPTLVVMKEGRMTSQARGVQTKEYLLSMLET